MMPLGGAGQGGVRSCMNPVDRTMHPPDAELTSQGHPLRYTGEMASLAQPQPIQLPGLQAGNGFAFACSAGTPLKDSRKVSGIFDAYL